MNWLTGRNVFILDAIGCGLGSIILWLAPAIWRSTELPDAWRTPVSIGLLVFAALLVYAWISRNRVLMGMSVIGNILWMIAAVVALAHSPSALGIFLIVVVLAADALMAWLQWTYFKLNVNT